MIKDWCRTCEYKWDGYGCSSCRVFDHPDYANVQPSGYKEREHLRKVKLAKILATDEHSKDEIVKVLEDAGYEIVHDCEHHDRCYVVKED